MFAQFCVRKSSPPNHSTSFGRSITNKHNAGLTNSVMLNHHAGKFTAAVRLILKSESSSSAGVKQLRRWFSSSSGKDSRLSGVIDAVNDRKLPPELRGQRNAVRSETDIINIVEQRIWHSMEEGQFENLPGKGKPLDLSSNPHADPAEDTLYRVLSKNKCLPEWVELNKEITNGILEWRLALKNAWACKHENEPKWIERSEVLKLRLRDINNKVFRYNLIVPFGRQMCGLKWEKEIVRLHEEQPAT